MHVDRALADRPDGSLARVVLFVDDPLERHRVARELGEKQIFGTTANVIFFSPSKFGSRRLNMTLQRLAPQGREPIVYDADLPTARRREVERHFNLGEARGMTLIGTSALELGVDIAGLDVCVMDELPSARSALLQRMGRVGRRPGKPGLVVLRLGGQPTDRDLAESPVSGLSLESAGTLPIPLHLDMIRWRHALACHRELARTGVSESLRRAAIERHFGLAESDASLRARYLERFGSLVDDQSPFWIYDGFRSGASKGKVPVVELDCWDYRGKPRFRSADGSRCDIAAGRGDADRAGDGEDDVLASAVTGPDLGRQVHVDGQLADPLADAVEQTRRNALASGRRRRVVLDADQELPARAVGEADAVLGQLGEVGGLARDRPQGLAVEVLALASWRLAGAVSHRYPLRRRAGRGSTQRASPRPGWAGR